MATALRVAFESGALKIPRNEKLIQQLHGIQRSISPAGTVRYAHTTGQHDDYVWALCMAVTGAQSPLPGNFDDIEQPPGRYETYSFGEEKMIPTGSISYETYAEF